jgi:hypothetical protein
MPFGVDEGNEMRKHSVSDVPATKFAFATDNAVNVEVVPTRVPAW